MGGGFDNQLGKIHVSPVAERRTVVPVPSDLVGILYSVCIVCVCSQLRIRE